MKTILALLLSATAVAAAGWIASGSADREAQVATSAETTPQRPSPATVEEDSEALIGKGAFSTPQREFAPYEPPDGESYVNAKRLAGRVAQRLVTFSEGSTLDDLADAVSAANMQPSQRRSLVAPLVDPARRSSGEVLYPQLSGVTATTLGAMVVVRQHLEDAGGSLEELVRVIDVRLRLVDGRWALDFVASVGGSPVPRPARLSPAARRVLNHPGIDLPDSARWDIYSGTIDDALLNALADAADRWPIAVSVLRSGHPRNVWATDRVSAHSVGYAADVYAVDGRLVQTQREPGSPAERLAASFVAAGAAQVGSPWNLAVGGRRSFTDRVHQDHIHVQQSWPRG